MNQIHPPINVPSEPLTFSLRRAAEEYPEKMAVITPEAGGKEYSYQWLEENSSAFAASLASLGVEPRDHIALWMKNSLEYILSFYGILKAGGVVVPVSTHYGEREVLHQLRETKVKGLITSDNLHAQAGNLLSKVQGLRFIVIEGQGEPPSNLIPFSSLLGRSNRLDRSIGLAAGGPPSDAERCFREAIRIAREQLARSWELRATTSLARMWAGQGRQAEAQDAVSAVSGWFTEGFETPDLQAARGLLRAD